MTFQSYFIASCRKHTLFFLKRTIFEEHCDTNLLKVRTSSEQRMAETNISFLQECVDVTRPTQKEKKYFFKEH